ncbi:MAG: hypothetical protein KAR42_11025 [candidate division Zixibacteria bacterium]|nr:hypothetical protein [candidate division Zixibacteria bacterium]
MRALFVNESLNGGSASGSPIEQISLGQFTSTANQAPTGTGLANAITLNFGVGGSTSGGEFTIAANGEIGCNMNSIQYNFEMIMRVARDGSSGVAEVMARMLYADKGNEFVQVGGTFGARIDSDDTVWFESFSINFSPAINSKIKFEIARNNGANDQGVVGTFQPAGDFVGAWNAINAVSLNISKTVVQ